MSEKKIKQGRNQSGLWAKEWNATFLSRRRRHITTISPLADSILRGLWLHSPWPIGVKYSDSVASSKIGINAIAPDLANYVQNIQHYSEDTAGHMENSAME